MDYTKLITTILETCLIPLLIALSGYLIAFLKIKAKELKEKAKNETATKYIDMVEKTISDCVTATTQTYVEALKKENAFTAEAQKEAFAMTYNAVLKILSNDCIEYLQVAFEDAEMYITNQIEAQVQKQKKEKED